MFRLTQYIALLMLQLFVAVPPRAEIITVGKDGNTRFDTIQAALDAAQEGDEIVVFPGAYVENVRFNGKNLILRSTAPQDEDVVTTTVIFAAQNGPAVAFSGAEGTTCVLAGFTIRNGSGALGFDFNDGDRYITGETFDELGLPFTPES